MGEVDLCSLPVNRSAELIGTCNFDNVQCGYIFPSVLWDIHTESFGSVIYGSLSGNDGGRKTAYLPKSSEFMYLFISTILQVYFVEVSLLLKYVSLRGLHLLGSELRHPTL